MSWKIIEIWTKIMDFRTGKTMDSIELECTKCGKKIKKKVKEGVEIENCNHK